MTYVNNEKRVQALGELVTLDDKWFFLTLNATTRSRYQFDEDLIKLSKWVNRFCLGRSALKHGNKLIICGSVELGKLQDGLHVHLIMNKPQVVKRSDQEIHMFIRRSWMKLTEAKGSLMGNLVHFQEAESLKSVLDYSVKTVKTLQNDNLVYI